MKGPLSLLIKKFLRIRLAPWRPLPRLCGQNFSDLLSRGSRLKTPGFSQTLNSNYHQPSTSPSASLRLKIPGPHPRYEAKFAVKVPVLALCPFAAFGKKG